MASVYSQGRGNVKVNIDGKSITMSDVLYVPEFNVNLMSISALNRNGLDVLF